jgi:AcrR family transcriptional regulator
MTRVREEKKEKTRQAILHAAVTLFNERGFDKTSVEDLAHTAGIGKGTIYGYFPSKKDILQAFIEHELVILHEELLASANRKIPILRQMVNVYMHNFKQLAADRELASIFIQEITFPRELDRHNHATEPESFFELLSPLLRRAQKRGELRKDLDLHHITRHFHALYLMLVSSWLKGRVRFEDTSSVLESMFQQALEGMQPRPKKVG